MQAANVGSIMEQKHANLTHWQVAFKAGFQSGVQGENKNSDKKQTFS